MNPCFKFHPLNSLRTEVAEHPRFSPVVASASAFTERCNLNRIGHMASVREKSGSKYWFARPYSQTAAASSVTKETDRKKAQRLGESFEEVARDRLTADPP